MEWVPTAEQSEIFESSLEVIYRNLPGCRNFLAVDIGCARGRHAFELAKFYKEVKAYDPVFSPWLEDHLSDFPNVDFTNVALGLQGQEREFFISSQDPTLSTFLEERAKGFDRSEKVKLRSLDSFNLVDVLFIKMDVEGFEFDVLQGAVKTIEQSQPVIYLEGAQKDSGESFKSFFSRMNYEFVSLNRGWEPFKEGEYITRDSLAYPKSFPIAPIQQKYLDYRDENIDSYRRWIK